MKVLIIKSKWFEDSDLRLDAEFHVSDGSVFKRVLKRSPYPTIPLSEVTSQIFKGNIFRRVYVDKPSKGHVFMTASDMMKSSIDTGKYISKKYLNNRESLEIKKGWILVSRSGTLGLSVFTNGDFEHVVGTDDLIRVVPNTAKIRGGFLYAYLASKPGYSLLVQPSYGGVVKHIEPHHIEKLLVPLFPQPKQNEVHNLITDASNLREEANGILNEVQEELLKKMDITKKEFDLLNSAHERSIKQSYPIKSRKLNPFTLRARNYSKRKEMIINHLAKGKYDKLIDVLDVPPFYGARFKRIESRSMKGIELLSQGDIFLQKPVGRIISKKSIKDVNNELVLKGMTLIPAQGTLGENEIFGRAKFVWGYLENKLVAGHAMRFVPKIDRIGAGYLYAVLSSPFWFRILRDSVYGTNLLGFIINLIQEYPIPRFHGSFENKIDNLVKSAFEKFTLANKREGKAITIVENEISSWQK